MTFDPNWMPWPLVSGMMIGRRHDAPADEPPDEPPEPEKPNASLAVAYSTGQAPVMETLLSKVLRGAHVGITVSILIFIWNQYEAVQAAKTAIITRAAVVDEQIRQLREDNATQDRITRDQLTELGHRLDIQRTGIDRTNELLMQHMGKEPPHYRGQQYP